MQTIHRGQVFGDLTAIEPAGSDARGNSLWRVRCVCGRDKLALEKSLLIGKTRSCQHRKRDPINIIGQTFGNLTVLELAGTDGRFGLVNARCVCGREKILRAANLALGLVKSCGCRGKKLDISPGDKFGILTAIKSYFRKANTNGHESRVTECRCDCGNVIVVRTAELRNRKSCGCLRPRKNKTAPAPSPAHQAPEGKKGKLFVTGIKRAQSYLATSRMEYQVCVCSCGRVIALRPKEIAPAQNCGTGHSALRRGSVFRRTWALVELLRLRETSITELADWLGTSKRTLKRDIKEIQKLFNVKARKKGKEVFYSCPKDPSLQ